MGCTIETLIASSGHVYRDPKNESGYGSLLAGAGYTCLTSNQERPVASNMGYGVYVAEDESKPVIIAFRGTQSRHDRAADMSIMNIGRAGAQYYRDIEKIYVTTRRKYPDRTVVFSGHSLGGHFAQHAATVSLRHRDENVLVRTFNSAPYKLHAEDEKRCREQSHRFYHYRLNNDPISKDMVGDRVGMTFTFPSGFVSAIKVHLLPTMLAKLPEKLRKSSISSMKPTDSGSMNTQARNLVIERMRAAACMMDLIGQREPRYKPICEDLKNVAENFANSEDKGDCRPDIATLNAQLAELEAELKVLKKDTTKHTVIEAFGIKILQRLITANTIIASILNSLFGDTIRLVKDHLEKSLATTEPACRLHSMKERLAEIKKIGANKIEPDEPLKEEDGITHSSPKLS